MNSDRHQVQLYVENAIGCGDPAALAQYKSEFEQFTVGYTASIDIRARMQVDAIAYTIKGLRSLMQGLDGLDQGHETWSVIRMYYSMYFLMRAKLAYNNVAFLRCKNIYTLRSSLGSTPEKKTGDKYRGDHKATITIFQGEFSNIDFFLSQGINEQTAFHWYSEKRDWVNYKRREFIDGSGMDGLNQLAMAYPDQVKMFCQNHLSIYSFDPDYALLALPASFAFAEVKAHISEPQIAAAIESFDATVSPSGCARQWINAL